MVWLSGMPHFAETQCYKTGTMTSKHGDGGGQNQQPKNCVKASHKLNLTTFAASVMFRSSIFLVRSALFAGFIFKFVALCCSSSIFAASAFQFGLSWEAPDKLLRSSQAPGTTTTRWPMSRPGSCLGTQSYPDEFTRGYLWYPWCQTCVCTIHQFIF